MNWIEKTVREWIREVGRAKTREVCIECDKICKDTEKPWVKAFNKVTHNNTKEA